MRRRAGRVRAGIGRMARFVMNAMLASGGYPWTVIRVEDRDGYLVRLEIASIDQDIGPFTTLVVDGWCGHWSAAPGSPNVQTIPQAERTDAVADGSDSAFAESTR